MSKKILSLLLSSILLIVSLSSMLVAFASTEYVIVYDEDNNECERFYATAPTFDDGGNLSKYGEITSALEDAFNYCDSQEDNYHYTIKTPEGEYLITKTLNPSSDTTLDMTAGTTLVNSANGGHNIIATRVEQTGYTGLVNFTINGGKMTYHEDNELDGSLLRLSHAMNITIKNVSFLDNTNSHHAELAACRNVTFDGCTFAGQKGTASDSSSEALQIDILHPEHFPYLGKYDGTMSDGITVKNCTFKNLVRGVGTHSMYAGYYQKNINITNNKFSNIQSTAISCYGYINSNISYNTITDCGEGVRYNLMVSDSSLKKVCVMNVDGKITYGTRNTDCKTKINNNTISVKSTALTPDALAINIYGNNVTAAKGTSFTTGNYYVSNVTVTNNNITTDAYGVRLYDVIKSNIASNTIKSSKKLYSGISLSDGCKNNTIKSNNITNFENCINDSTTGDSNQYISNKLSTPAKNGIIIQKGSKNATIKSNTASKCGSNGIQIYNGSTATTISSNNVTSSTKNGILLSTKSKATTVSSNTTSSNKENGIYVDATSSASKITSNTSTGNTKQGISVAGTVSSVASNILKSNKKYGLFFGTGSKATTVSSNQTYSSNTSGKAYSQGGSKSYKFGNISTPAITLSTKSKAVTIKWKKISGVTKYEVYRATSKSGTYSKIATVDAKKTEYKNSKLTKGKTYYYKVRAVQKMNGVTAYSKYSSIKYIKVK